MMLIVGEADDAFQSLSENTQKQDKKMRPSPRNRNVSVNLTTVNDLTRSYSLLI